MLPTILATKLYIPQIPDHFVPRGRLISVLNKGLEMNHRLTLLSAPAGYGKTTVIAEWSRSLSETTGRSSQVHSPRTQFTWLSLDQGDNDPALFFAYLTVALRKIDNKLGQNTLGLLQMTPMPPIQSLVTELINDLSDLQLAQAQSPIYVLVLDEYQVIHNDAIHQAIAFLVEHQPACLHLVLITRQDPPLPLPRLRVRRQLTEIRSDDLRMTKEEIDHFIRQTISSQTNEKIIIDLENRTEGWVAGLQMAALAMQSRLSKQSVENPNGDREGDTSPVLLDFMSSFAGDHHYIIDYLATEVLSSLPASTRNFLRQTALLDRFCASLCDAVCDVDDSYTILRQLERDNLFLIPLDSRREWYRYHPLFRDFLQTETRPSERQLWHFRAAGWFESHGYSREAVKHMIASGNIAETRRIVLWAGEQAIHRGEHVTLLGWLETLSDAMMSNDMELATLNALALFTAGKYEAAKSYTLAAKASQRIDTPRAVKGKLICLQTYFAFAEKDYRLAVQLGREALELLDEDQGLFHSACLVALGHAQQELGDDNEAINTLHKVFQATPTAENTYARVYATGILARTHNSQGKRRVALALCQQAIDQYVNERGRPLPLTGYIYVQLGALHYEANSLALAEQYLRQGLQFCEETAQAGSILGCKHRLALLFQAQGKSELALETIRDIQQLSTQANLYGYSAQFAALEADYLLAADDLPSVERWDNNAFRDITDSFETAHAHEYLTHIRLLLVTSRADEALELLSKLEHSLQAHGRNRDLITSTILRSVAELSLKHEKESLQSMEKALRLAAPEGYLRAFLDECHIAAIRDRVYELLAKLTHITPAFTNELLSSEHDYVQSTPNRRLLKPQNLSARELEILVLIERGLSNQEIAESLILSLNTIKWHIQHIYAKLGTQTRTQAISRARDLGLL